MAAKKLSISGTFQSLGPGLLLAGTATGVSHLVQATRAGADYGFSLLYLLTLTNFLKYPFFLFGPRYAAATGESLIDGYHRLGRGYLIVFALITTATMLIIQAAVTLVTSGVAGLVLPPDWNPSWTALTLLLICGGLLGWGRYSLLDRIVKVVIALLVLSTLGALILALRAPSTDISSSPPHWWTPSGIAFVIALMGWMPAPIDVSVWNSVWTLARKRQTQHTPSLQEESIDFHLGYIGCALLSICFLSLGALVMFGSGLSFSESSVGFAEQFTKLYTKSLGQWARPLILTAAFTTMFSTTLSALDAYVRVCRRVYYIAVPLPRTDQRDRHSYWVFLSLIITGSMSVLSISSDRMLSLVDIATILSFLSAPVLAFMNLRVIQSSHTPEYARPSLCLTIWSYCGLIFLCVFCLVYLVWRF